MSTPDAQDKKVPQFSSFTMRPATAPAESCCTDHACATESAPAAEALSDARYSWQVDGMDCAACARKVETAVRQVPGVSQVQVLFATEKLLVNAEGDVRAQVENAVRQAVYAARCRCSAAKQTRVAAARQSAVTDAGYHDGLELGAGAGQPPCRSVGLYCHHPGWPVAGCPPGATPDQERELVRH